MADYGRATTNPLAAQEGRRHALTLKELHPLLVGIPCISYGSMGVGNLSVLAHFDYLSITFLDPGPCLDTPPASTSRPLELT
jgi:hypothetical protein